MNTGSFVDWISIHWLYLVSQIRPLRTAIEKKEVLTELVLEVPPAEKTSVEAIVKQEMEGALKLRVPLRVDLGWGKNWNECE